MITQPPPMDAEILTHNDPVLWLKISECYNMPTLLLHSLIASKIKIKAIDADRHQRILFIRLKSKDRLKTNLEAYEEVRDYINKNKSTKP